MTNTTSPNPTISKLSDKLAAQQEDMLNQAEMFNAGYGKLNKRPDGSINTDKYDCAICRNKGYTYSVEFAEQFQYFSLLATPCSCWAKRNPELEQISPIYSLDDFIAKEDWQKKMISVADDYLSDGAGHFFYAGGAIGSGKSHICFGVLRKMAAQGRKLKVMYWSSDVMRLKNYDDDSYSRMINSFCYPDVLYIEDFYKRVTREGISEADKNIAFDVINSRYMKKKQTLFSSEYLLSELINIDNAVGSRIYEMCGERFRINIGRTEGKNYRLISGKNELKGATR